MKKIILTLFFLNFLIVSSDDVAILRQNPWSDLLDIITNPQKQDVSEIEVYIKTVKIENIPDNVKKAFISVAKDQKDIAINNLRNKICLNTASWNLLLNSLDSAKNLALRTCNSILQINKLIPFALAILVAINFKQYCSDKNINLVQITQYGLYALSAYLGSKMIANLIHFTNSEETLLAKRLTKSSHILYILQKHFESK